MIFTAPAILKIGSPTAEGGMRLRAETNALSDEEKLMLLKFDGDFGYIMFSKNSISEKDIPKEDAPNKDKTPSKRLRSVLFVRWTQAGSVGDFEIYYRLRMEDIINKVKQTLD